MGRPLVHAASDDSPGDDDRGGFQCDPRRTDAARGRRSAQRARDGWDEPSHPRRERQVQHAAQRLPLRTPAACMRRALVARAQVRAERPALVVRQPPFELPCDRGRRIVTRELLSELLPKRSARTEQQGLERRHRDLHRRRHVRVRPSLQLAHHERRPLRRWKLLDRATQLLSRRCAVVLDRRHGELAVKRDLAWPPLVAPEALQARVVGDRDQPLLGLLRSLAALERAIRVHERRLGDVLRVRLLAEYGQRVAEDVRCVAAVQLLEFPIVADRLLGRQDHGSDYEACGPLEALGRGIRRHPAVWTTPIAPVIVASLRAFLRNPSPTGGSVA